MQLLFRSALRAAPQRQTALAHATRGAYSAAAASRSGGSRRRSSASTAAFFGVPVAVTFTLGAWQVKRLERKRGLIAERERTLALEPVGEEALGEDVDYRRVTVTGELLHAREMLVGPRGAPSGTPAAALQWGGSTGYLVATPLRTLGGRHVVVVRGWVPLRLADRARRAAADVERVTLTGVLRAGEERNRFVPENDAAKGEWFYVDTRTMLRAAGLALPEEVEVEGEGGDKTLPFVELLEPVPEGGWPLPRGLDEHLTFRTPPSTHITYATTWFTLSGALALLARARIRK